MARIISAAVLALTQIGCGGTQSALNPASWHASSVANLFWIMTTGTIVIWVLMMVLAAWVSSRQASERAANVLVWIGALFITPGVILVLLLYGLSMIPQLRAAGGTDAVQIRVTGEQYWWRVEYQTDGVSLFTTANEIVLPVGRATDLALISNGVIHSLWIPALAGKVDMIPGRTNRLNLKPDRTGRFRGQCAEFCGTSHSFMALDVQVLEPEAFEQWLQARRLEASAPVTAQQQRGAEVFFETGCQACHTIRGTTAMGQLGPDLTHYGSRHTVAAGLYPNNIGTTAGWIAGAQHLKPGNQMPSFGPALDGPALRAVADYLTTLK